MSVPKESMSTQELLRHLLATLHYRATNVLADAPYGYPTWTCGEGVRTPWEILSHTCDVLDYVRAMTLNVKSERGLRNSWEEEVERFYAILAALDTAFATAEAIPAEVQRRLLQGPLSDAMTHVGQLALIRRLAGAPVSAENFFAAEIATDQLHADPNQDRD